MTRVLNPQYDDQLRGTAYPFLGTDPLTTTDGYVIPNDAFLDASLLVPLETESVTLHAIDVAGDSTLTLHFNTPTGELGTATVGLLDEGIIDIVDQVGNSAGMIRIANGPMGAVRAWPQGTRYVDRELLPHLLVATPGSSQRAIQMPDGTIVRGSLYLVGGPGVHLDLDPSTSGVRVNVVGEPYSGRIKPLRSIASINGIAVDNWILTSAAASSPQATYRVKVEPAGQGLKISLVGTATGGVQV